VLNDVERVADRVGMIRDGELVAVERPDVLAGRAWRNVKVQLAELPEEKDIAELRGLRGVEKLEVEGASASLVVHEDVDSVMRILSRTRILQLDVERPPLEELFLKYYGRGAAR
jgi:ABC-2 type transport system ATP-binding protein